MTLFRLVEPRTDGRHPVDGQVHDLFANAERKHQIRRHIEKLRAHAGSRADLTALLDELEREARQ